MAGIRAPSERRGRHHHGRHRHKRSKASDLLRRFFGLSLRGASRSRSRRRGRHEDLDSDGDGDRNYDPREIREIEDSRRNPDLDDEILVLEFMRRGNLEDWLCKAAGQNKQIPNKVFWRIFACRRLYLFVETNVNKG